VVRGIKPAVFEIWKDGEMINQAASNIDYQEELEKRILQTNFKTFSQIVILGKASYVPFLQLKPMDRRTIVEDLYDLRVFSTMNSLLSKKITVAEKEINTLENERDMLVQKLILSRQHQNVQSEDKLKWIEQKSLDIEKTLVETNRIDAAIQILEEDIEALHPNVEEEQRYKIKVRELRTIRAGITSNEASIEKEIRFLCENESCPTCQQYIAVDFRERALLPKQEKLKEVSEGLRFLDEKLAKYEVRLETLSVSGRKINDNQTRVIVLKSQLENQKRLRLKLEQEIRQLETEHEEVIDEAAIIELETGIIEKKRDWGNLKIQSDMMGYVSILLKDNGIKSKIVKKYSGTFNDLVNSYLAKLDFFVDFHLDESFEEVIKSRGRDDFSYNSFSEGEKLRIDLAVLFAWRDIAKLRASLNTNLLIMDEIFDSSMDSIGKEELMKIMKSIRTENNTFVISHQAEAISDQFDRTLQFTKIKGFSRYDVR